MDSCFQLLKNGKIREIEAFNAANIYLQSLGVLFFREAFQTLVVLEKYLKNTILGKLAYRFLRRAARGSDNLRSHFHGDITWRKLSGLFKNNK